MRGSEEVQAKYSRSFDCGNEYLSHVRDVTVQLQLQSLRDSGVKEKDLQSSLLSLQSHRYHYQWDAEILSKSVYGRYDNSRPSPFTPAQYSLDHDKMLVPLISLDGVRTTVGQMISKAHSHTFVVAGSLS